MFGFFPPLYAQALRGLALSIMCTDAIVFWVHSFKVPCRSSLVNRYSKKIISKPCYSLPLALLTNCLNYLFSLFIGLTCSPGVFLFQLEVMEISLSQCGQTRDRQLAIIDKNRDLYLTPVKHIGPAERLVKLG